MRNSFGSFKQAIDGVDAEIMTAGIGTSGLCQVLQNVNLGLQYQRHVAFRAGVMYIFLEQRCFSADDLSNRLDRGICRIVDAAAL